MQQIINQAHKLLSEKDYDRERRRVRARGKERKTA